MEGLAVVVGDPASGSGGLRGGAKPNIALVTGQHVPHAVVDQAITGRVVLERLAVVAGGGAIPSTEPQAAEVILNDGEDDVFGQSILRGEGGEVLAVVARDPTTPRTEPHVAVLILSDSEHAALLRCILPLEAGEGLSIITADPA